MHGDQLAPARHSGHGSEGRLGSGTDVGDVGTFNAEVPLRNSLSGQGRPFSHGPAQIGAPSRVRFPRAGNVKPLVQKEVVERTERRQHVEGETESAAPVSFGAALPGSQ